MESIHLRITLLVLVFFSGIVIAEGQRPKKALRAYEAAESAFQRREYTTAHQQALKAILADPNYAEAWLLEGEIGVETNDIALAMMGYEKALAIDSLVFPPAAIALARLYDRQGAYKKEVSLLRWYQRAAKGNATNDATVAEMLEGAVFRDDAVSHPVSFKPESIGNMVNTVADEYVNMLQFDGSQMLFTRKVKMDDGYAKEFLFVSPWDGKTWGAARQLAFVAFPEDVDLAAAYISADGRKLYLTGCGWGRDSGCDLYVSEWSGLQWSEPQIIGGGINTAGWESQPCVSSDGKELYFVSRRAGNADIYCAYRNADGTWGEPQNLGMPINTKGSEMAPFIHSDGRTLYFSSDKHIGMGGFDLFMSHKGKDGQWQEPVNLGFPINTSGDEINFFVAVDGKTAFISSIREGGMGGYDIYTFELPETIRPDSANYLSSVDVVELHPGDALVLQNIHFEFNSFALTADSESGVQMLFDFLQRNPNLNVELAGHTDDIGKDNYNRKLSADRAEVVRKALISKGINEKRLTAKGYGATKPLVTNDSDEHRALNRRTEIIIR